MKTPFFSVKVKPNSGTSSRIGVVAGKNVHKTAVKRNFWKRQARAALEKASFRGKDVIVILQPRVNELTKRAFQEEIRKALHAS